MDPEDSDDNSQSSLLPQQSIKKMTVAALCVVVFSESMTMTFVFSFVYFMVRDFKIGNAADIGFYCGVLTAAYSFGQTATSLFWGWVSDRRGRRPVLLIGMLGSTISILLFGLSGNFTWACLVRAICGMFNGNLGVSKAAFAEAADRSSRPFLFSLLGLSWAVGTVLGPIIGMTASEKTISSKNIFQNEYPYLLPCAICSIISLVGFLVNLVYLEETAKHLGIYQYVLNIESSPVIEEEFSRYETNRGGMMANFLEPSSRATVTEVIHSLVNREVSFDEPAEAIWDAEALGIHERDSGSDSDENSEQSEVKIERSKPNKSNSLRAITGYCLLQLQSIVFEEFFTIWAVAPLGNGLAFSSDILGSIYGLNGCLTILFQLVAFPFLVKKMSCLTMYRASLFSFFAIWTILPIITIKWQDPSNRPGFWPVLLSTLAFRRLAHVLTFTSINLVVANSAPRQQLAIVNSLGGMIASFIRGVGPILAGAVWSFSIRPGHQFPFDHFFVVLMLITLSSITTFQSFFIR